MPGQTTHAYPYPLGTDRVTDGDDAIHSLATAVDTQLGATASGRVSLGNLNPSTNTAIAVTFPVGRFLVVGPNINVMANRVGNNTGSASTSCSVGGISNTGCTLNLWQAAGVAGSADMAWYAVQHA